MWVERPATGVRGRVYETARTGTNRIVVENLARGQDVRDVSFVAEPGAVTGLVGPPKSGKSLVLRMVLGLIRPTSGRALIDVDERIRPGRTVGAVLDDPGFHPGRRAADHLRVHAAALRVDDRRVGEVLDLVGLRTAADRSASRFDPGMRQRLALATALLADPPVLVLDQPGVGLPGPGLAWLGSVIAELARHGRTVLVAGIRLDGIADRQVLMREGRCVHNGTEPGATAFRELVLVGVDSPGELTVALRAAGITGISTGDDGTLAISEAPSLRVAEIADRAGVRIHAMRTERLAR